MSDPALCSDRGHGVLGVQGISYVFVLRYSVQNALNYSAEFRKIPCRVIGRNIAEFGNFFMYRILYISKGNTQKKSCCPDISRCFSGPCGVNSFRCSQASEVQSVDTSRCSIGLCSVDTSWSSSGPYMVYGHVQVQHRSLQCRHVLVQLRSLWCTHVQVQHRSLQCRHVQVQLRPLWYVDISRPA